MIDKFTVNYKGRTEDVQIECKECSKDGLKYICTLANAETFRMKLNEHAVWVAKREDCTVDPELIKAIGERYDECRR